MIRTVVLACLPFCLAQAAVTLPTLLADHMVIQRGVPVHIWGKADPGEVVSASFRGETKAGAADALGQFHLYLFSGAAGGPFELTVRGANEIVLTDVLVGDVWVAAGQSNMEWPVRWASRPEAEIAASKHPRIRLFRAMHRVSEFAFDDLWGQPWTSCGPESVADFSAVGYHFGRSLQERLDVPIGLIQMAWGGTPIDSWTSYSAITGDAALMPALAEWAKMMRNHPAALLRYQQECRKWEAAAARAKAARQPFADPPPIKPVGPEGPWKPGAIFNAMVLPAAAYPIRGVIWYQGESNTSAERAPLYGRLFRTMIDDWRRVWNQGDFPFLFVQLAGFTAAPDSWWPELREAQRQALSVANTGMAVAVDLGERDSIHPKNKREVGRRLSLVARAVVSGEQLVYSGPLFRRTTREDGALRLWFDHTGGGLVARGGALRGFEVAGGDQRWETATARIEDGTVVVSSPAVGAPLYVRYGWADFPDCNLYNAEGLPAAPFGLR
ncbi:MAG: sialate O-acetylesterase [Candidatus Solibacter sp.]|nr:sialate O-acetylesterase [Candidatus Solibacter sp.]